MTTPDLDLLIDQAVTGAQISAGQHPTGELPSSLFAGANIQERSAKAPEWTRAEEEYLVEHYVTMTDAEIGAVLGRSAIGVHIHREREMNLTGPSKAPGVITVNRAAKMLGLSSCHALAYWFDVGLLPGYILPGGNMCRLIRMEEFKRWVCNPANWIYIDIEKIRDERLYRMAHKRLERWGDAWWTTPQVAHYLGVRVADAAGYLKRGRLKGVQAEYSIGGRELDRHWRYWFILRSDALAFTVPTRRNRSQITPAGEAWILRARDELHLSFVQIAHSMNPRRLRPGRRMITDGMVWQRYKVLKGK
jgi:hypothetical protein